MIRALAPLALLLAAALVLPAAAAPPHPGDEALRPHLERAELALRGKILSFPRNGNRGEGPARYRVDFLVHETLKGDRDIDRRILRIDIERFEADPRRPEVVSGKRAILLVRKLDPGSRVFTTVDPWFGMLPDNPRLAAALAALAAPPPPPPAEGED